jgi:D-tyrosyl-tRNA(Tyr) deacylase
MRLLIQRVRQASVTLTSDDRTVARIGRGMLVLVGIGPHDGPAEVAWAQKKLLSLRIFGDADGKMNLDVASVDGALLLVSQFTLYADLGRGRRPSFIGAAPPERAAPRFDELVASLRESGRPVEIGAFGQSMAVALVNDGPVTLWLDSDAD